MSDELDWDRDGRDWPNAEYSRFESVGGLRWHVQDLGAGPVLLLLHGTGATTHSWAGLAPLLAEDFRVVAPDLPGHGFTQLASARQSSLPGMAGSIAALLRHLELSPELVVGHSAGAAVLARMCLDGAISPAGLVSLNGALLPLHGIPGHLFAPAARLLASIPAVPRFFAYRASDRRMVERLVRQTGSTLPAAAVDRYRRLLGSPKHVSAALRMMANWDLVPLARELARLPCPLYLIACDNDRAVPPSEARRVLALLPDARLRRIRGLGHVGHEEDPELFATLIRSISAELRVTEEGEGRAGPAGAGDRC